MDYSQSPYPQPYQPSPDYARQAASTRCAMTPGVITPVLYFVLRIPGLIANIAYLSAANADRSVSGMGPQGRGCLVALLVVFIGLAVLGVAIGGASATPTYR